ETSSNVDCGFVKHYVVRRQHVNRWGIAQNGTTSTVVLADRYAAQLGHSRQIVFKAMRAVEGCAEAVQTYDGPKISWGINQWTWPAGPGAELLQILSY